MSVCGYSIINRRQAKLVDLESLPSVNISKSSIDSIYQPWSGLPNNNSIILTVYDVDENIYLVNVNLNIHSILIENNRSIKIYNKKGQQIFPKNF